MNKQPKSCHTSKRFNSIKVMYALLTLFAIAFVIFSTIIFRQPGSQSLTNQKSVHIQLIKLDQSLNFYMLDLKIFPNNLHELFEFKHPNWKGPYIKSKDLKDPWGMPYQYHLFPESNTYQLISFGKDKVKGGEGFATDQISKGSMIPIKP